MSAQYIDVLSLNEVKEAEEKAKNLRVKYEKQIEDAEWNKFLIRYNSNELMSIGEFCPSGTQIEKPGGFSFRPKDVTAVEVNGRNSPGGIMLHFGTSSVLVEFYYNVDGGPAEIYAIAAAIKGKRWPDGVDY